MSASNEGEYRSPTGRASAEPVGGGNGVFSTGGQYVEGASALRDRDPPPAYDGENAEVTFRTFKKNVALWEYVTDIPKAKRGIKLLQSLSGTARIAVEEMEIDELAGEDGVRNVMRKLEDFYMPHLEVSLPRAFESAVYGSPRSSKESFAEFIARMEKAFVRLEKEGVKLPDGAQGYILYRQSALTESQDQRLLVWSDGKYDKGAIVKSLRKLDKVIKDSKGKSHYLDESQVASEEHYPTEFDPGMDDDDDPDYIYVAEGDLDHVMDESDVHEALASYQDVRRALKDQQKGRGFYGNHKGKGTGAFGKSGGKGKMQRVHLEQIKLRTRCHRCKAIGHWARECEGEEKPWSSVHGSQSSQSTGSKSGFLVVSHENRDQPQSQFWLRQFVEGRKAQRQDAVSDVEAYKERNRGSFCGIVTESHDGVVDTAAEGGLVGSHALDRLLQHLRQVHGLRGKWVPKTSAAKGVGGQAKVVGVIMLPLGIGGINGVLECTVVDGEVPLLLPVRLMRTLQATISFLDHTFKIPEYNVTINMHALPSGHVTIPVTQFENNRFEMPPNTPGCVPEDFHVPHVQEHHMITTEAMGTSQSVSPNSNPELYDPSSVLPSDGLVAGKSEESRVKVGSPGVTGGGDGSRAPTKASPKELESAARQGLHTDGLQPTPAGGKRVVSALAAIACLAAGTAGREHPGCVCHPHPRCQSFATTQSERAPQSIFQHLRAPEGEVEGRGQCVSLLCGVSGVSCEVGDPRQSGVFEEGAQGGEERGSLATQGEDKSSTGIPSHRGSEEQWGAVGSPGRCLDESRRRRVEDSGGYGGRMESSVGGGGSQSLEGGDEAPEGGGSRGEPEARCSDLPVDEEPGGDPGESGKHQEGSQGHTARGDQEPEERGFEEPQEPHTSRGSEVQVWGSCRAPDCQEGRPEEGANLLQMHAEEVRVLSMGHRSSEGGRKCHLEPTVFQLERSEHTSHPTINQSEEPTKTSRDNNIPQIQEPQEEPRGYPREVSGLHQQHGVSLEDEGGWMYAEWHRQRKVIRAAQRNGQSGGVDGYVEAPANYEVWVEETQSWEQRKGIVPLHTPQPVRVKARLTRRGVLEEKFGGDALNTSFTNKQRKLVFAGFEEMAKRNKERRNSKVISEVYSPPRVSAEGVKRGWTQGKAYDLDTGWDLRRTDHRKQMWRSLKEDDPDLIVICPPCVAFSILQELNFPRMGMAKSVKLLQTGLEHLEIAMEVAKWQHRRGKVFVFEHPELARSWSEPCVQALLKLEGVIRTRCDMCAYGMAVDAGGFNKKPTGIAVNSIHIARRLSMRCPGGHQHQPTMEGRPKKAQVYPKKFCQAILKGFEEEAQEIWALAEDEEEDDENEESPVKKIDRLEERGEVEGDRQITPQEKASVLKLHKGVGHPNLPDFVRFLKTARVKDEVIRWTAREFRCPTCEANPRPKPSRLASIPKSFQPGRVLGVDLIYIPEVGGGSTFPALNMIDWGTGYQMVERADNKDPRHLWELLWRSWARVFGVPKLIICDGGREFISHFIQQANGHGVAVHQIGAKAPWQQGRTERHGGHFKELLAKARQEVVITEDRELRLLMQEVEQAKNRFSHRSGFSPVQRQIGHWPRVPGEILGDDVLDPMLVQGSMVDDIERIHEMRRIAQKAFVDYNTQRSKGRVERGRTRTTQEFQAGDYVFVYRVERARKKKHGGVDLKESPSHKPQWVGPGTVVAIEGANLFVVVAGELWKVAREQCRLATNQERQGIELVLQECQDLIEEYKRNSHRAGYKDITQEEWPKEEEESQQEEPPKAQGAPLRQVRFQDEEGAGSPGETERGLPDDVVPSPESPIPTPEEATPTRVGEGEDEVSRQTSFRTIPEPEAETSESRRASRVIEVEAPLQHRAHEAVMQDVLRRSQEMADRLDGTPRGPIRFRGRGNVGQGPYYAEHYMVHQDEEEEVREEEMAERLKQLLNAASFSKEGPKGDYWEVDVLKGEVVRHHVRKRKAPFHPHHCRESPAAGLPLKETRVTKKKACGEGGAEEILKDFWVSKGSSRISEGGWWKGQTVFFIDQSKVPHYEALQALAVEKRGGDEIDMKRESEEAKEGWKMADAAEWNKIVQSGAVKVLSVEESEQVRRSLQAQGKEARVLPTRMVRRYKPSEQPGTPPTQKSRLCIRGDLDPDILSLERFAPTVNTMNLNVVLQLAANLGFEAEISDFKNAFCQSNPLHRENGPLYFQQPKEGISGLDPRQIVLVITGCYGLVDSPLHWRKSLVEQLAKIGYFPSRLDPCVFKMYEQNQLQGIIVVEVDDLFMVGNTLHQKRVQELKKKFTFGKWVRLKDEAEGAMFNGRRLRQLPTGEFQVDMEKFVLERLHEIPVAKERLREKGQAATEQEKSQARAACGSLNWLSKEGRPDASGPASLLSSRLTSLTVEDLVAINEAVRRIKQAPELKIRIQPLKEMKLSIVTDASFGNHGYHSQGGQMVICHEQGLKDNRRVKSNLLCWRSGRIQRVVNSTLAAETQSLSKGFGDLLWVMILFEELKDEHFQICDWPARLSGSDVLAMVSSSSSEELRGSLAVVDAKSLYDYLSKDTIGGQDKRTAIEIQIIREDLSSLGGQIRWVDHPAMLADGLTKLKGSNEALFRMLDSGLLKLTEEEQHMEARSQALQDSEAQGQLLRLQQFRSSLSYMQHFFHDYEKCTLALPVTPELKFVADLVNRKEELSHLPLLGHFVRLRNWIFDRLDGALPKAYLKEPLKVLLKRAMLKDEKMNHRSKKIQCDATLRSLKLFIQSWKAFYDANQGAIPVECQAGRAAMGLDAQETKLEKIGPGAEEDNRKLELEMGLGKNTQFRLPSGWNELVDAAALALNQLGKSHAANWAAQMQKAAPVGLADLFFQEHLVDTLQSRALQRSVLRNLCPSEPRVPRVAWTAVQLEILSSSWIHRIQKLDFPEMEEPAMGKGSMHSCIEFRSAVSEDKTATMVALSDEKREEVLDKLARMQLADLQVCRDWARQIQGRLSTSDASAMILEHEDVRELSGIPQAVLEILEGILAEALLRLLEEENGDFGHHLSPKDPAPCDLQSILDDLGSARSLRICELAKRDALLRETISNLEHQPFCDHAMKNSAKPLLEMYTEVYVPEETPLAPLPEQIRGCHLLAVLQSLRSVLREVRRRKAELDQGTAWDPQQGLQPLPEWVLAEAKMGGSACEAWWEGSVDETSAAQNAGNSADPEMGSIWSTDLNVLSFMCWACHVDSVDPSDGYLQQLMRGPPSVDKLLQFCGWKEDAVDHVQCIHRFLDTYEKQMIASSTKEGSSALQRSLSAVELVPLKTLLGYKDKSAGDLDPEAVSQELWHIAMSQIAAQDELEEAIGRVLKEKMPKIVNVPREAEDLALSGQEIILKHRDQYFEVKSMSPNQPELLEVQLAQASSKIQRVWRTWHARQVSKENDPTEMAALEPSVKLESSAAQEETEHHEEKNGVKIDPPKGDQALAVCNGSNGSDDFKGYPGQPCPEKPAPDLVEVVEGTASEMLVPWKSHEMGVIFDFSIEWMEETRSIHSFMASQSSRLTGLGGEAAAWTRFTLTPELLVETSYFRTIAEVEGNQKWKEHFVAAMGELPELPECISPIKKALRRQTPPPVSNLTDHELYALLCYTMELRKKWKQADAKMNFAAKMKALEKCKEVTVQPQSLYCVMMHECLDQLHELRVGEEVIWPTYTSWTTSQEKADAMLQAAHALGGFVVQLDTVRSASEISVFRSARREASSEFVLPVNTPLQVKMVATDAGAGLLTSIYQKRVIHVSLPGDARVVLLLEEVDDDED
eukprot:s671_g15.t1